MASMNSRTVASRIVGYLKSHPDACDTAEGVRWWLDDPAVTIEDVASALDDLVSKGHVERMRGPAGDVFRRAPVSK
jgi:DNA-binding MarR family transcriptional regulator